MNNQNPAMKKSGLKGSFPSGNGGSLNTGLSSREAISHDPKTEGMDTSGASQRPMPTPAKKAGRGTSFA